LVKTFSDVEKNRPLLFVDSRGGHLGLAIRQGDFARAYGITPPQLIVVAPRN
jgi:S-adenosylmethionine hydrolase